MGMSAGVSISGALGGGDISAARTAERGTCVEILARMGRNGAGS